MKKDLNAREQRVLDFMKEYKGITSYEAVTDLGELRLSARIFDLKAKGIEIESDYINVKNRWGGVSRVKKYWLA